MQCLLRTPYSDKLLKYDYVCCEGWRGERKGWVMYRRQRMEAERRVGGGPQVGGVMQRVEW